MTCEFCGKSHVTGVPIEMLETGHPYLALHSEVGGSGLKIKGRYTFLSNEEIKARLNNGWHRLGRWVGPEPSWSTC